MTPTAVVNVPEYDATSSITDEFELDIRITTASDVEMDSKLEQETRYIIPTVSGFYVSCCC